MIIHINGMPGVGKLTIAKFLAKKLGARLIDNHLLIDLVTAIYERGSSEYMLMVKKLIDIVLGEIAKNPNNIFIFTNALAAELSEDRSRLTQLSQFAHNHGLPFVQVRLDCDLEENKQRISSKARKLKGKLVDTGELEKLRQNYSIYHPPADYQLTIDTTHLTVAEVSEQIVKYIPN